MKKALPYIGYVSKTDINNFVKENVINIFGESKSICICNWTYSRNTTITFIIDLGGNKFDRKLTKCYVKINDFKCEIQIGAKKYNYTKDWAKLVCKSLDDTSIVRYNPMNINEQLTNIPTSEQYKAEYNAYWQKVKQEKIKQAESEFEQISF